MGGVRAVEAAGKHGVDDGARVVGLRAARGEQGGSFPRATTTVR